MDLVSLAPELIVGITSHLNQNDICNFARTCRKCSRCSQQYLYHRITLNVAEKERTAWKLSKTLENKWISRYVRHLCLNGDALSMESSYLEEIHLQYHHRFVRPSFSQLVEKLRRLTQLEYLYLDGNSYCNKWHDSTISTRHWLRVPRTQPIPRLTVLEVTTCIDPILLSELLQITPSLKTFCWVPKNCSGDPRIWTVLQDYNHSTLRTLKYKHPDDHDITPLQEFRILESLSLSTALCHKSLWDIVPRCIVEVKLTLGQLERFDRLGYLFYGLDLTAFPRLKTILVDASDLLRSNEDEEEYHSYLPSTMGITDYDGSDSQLVKVPVEKLTWALLESGIIQDIKSQLDQAMVEGSRSFGIHLLSGSRARFIGVSL